VTAPVDITIGHASGRRQHKPIVITWGKRQHVSRDTHTGLSTGRRMHRP
jgi:hypothetical protein